MLIVDVRDQLLRARNPDGSLYSYGRYGPKIGLAGHWNGGPVPRTLLPIEVLEADARFHVETRGWDGISYHGAIDWTGVFYLCRDDDAVLASTGSELGNEAYYQVQLMYGEGQEPTPMMLATFAELCRKYNGIVNPHKWFSPTQCPGPFLTNWISDRKWEDIVVTDPNIIAAIYDAAGENTKATLVHLSRLQRGMDVERGEPFDPTKPPLDPRVIVKT